MSPNEQMDIMLNQEEKMRVIEGEPNEKDLEASISEFSEDSLSCWLESYCSPVSNQVLILTLLTQAYMYYITTGVPSSVLAPQPLQQMMNIMRLVPPETEYNSKNIQNIRANMEEEVKRDYYFSLKKSIGIKQLPAVL